MRMLKYAILGLVCRESMTGYDIKKAFDETMSKFWSAKHSQIYPELNSLLVEGLVEYRITVQGTKLEKKLYSITEKGKAELAEWIKSRTPIEEVHKEAFRLKLYFGENYATKDELVLVFQDQYEQHNVRLEELKKRIGEISNPMPKRNTPDFSEYLLARGGIMREEAYLAWLRECMGLLDISI